MTRLVLVLTFCLGGAIAAEPIRLENAQVRLGFDQLGRIVELVNRTTGVSYLAAEAKPAPPFVLDVYSANQALCIRDPEEEQTGGFSLADPAPVTAEPGDLSHLVPTQAAAPGVVTVEADGLQRLRWTYVFPEHPIYSGSCNNQGGLVNYYPDRPARLTRQDAMNRVFLMGYRFDVLGHPLGRTDDYMLYLKDLIALRQEIKGELYRSAFRDTVGLGAVPERVEVKVFRHASGASLTLTLLDRRERKDAFDLTIDLDALQVGAIGSGMLHQFRSPASALVAKSSDGNTPRLTLRVPPRNAVVAAIILQP